MTLRRSMRVGCHALRPTDWESHTPRGRRSRAACIVVRRSTASRGELLPENQVSSAEISAGCEAARGGARPERVRWTLRSHGSHAARRVRPVWEIFAFGGCARGKGLGEEEALKVKAAGNFTRDPLGVSQNPPGPRGHSPQPGKTGKSESCVVPGEDPGCGSVYSEGGGGPCD